MHGYARAEVLKRTLGTDQTQTISSRAQLSRAMREQKASNKPTCEVEVEIVNPSRAGSLKGTMSRRLAAREERTRPKIQSLLTNWEHPLTKEELRQRRESGMPDDWVRSSRESSASPQRPKSNEERDFEAALAHRRGTQRTNMSTSTSTSSSASFPSPAGLIGESWKALCERTIVAVDNGLRTLNSVSEASEMRVDPEDEDDYFMDEFGDPLES